MKKSLRFVWKKSLVCFLSFAGLGGCSIVSCAYGGPPVDMDDIYDKEPFLDEMIPVEETAPVDEESQSSEKSDGGENLGAE